MKIINYNNIDFNELNKLDIDSSESDIYAGKDENDEIKIYKIFKPVLNVYELTLKSEKLNLLEKKKVINSIVLPDSKIINPSLSGIREAYIEGIDLSYARAVYEDEEIISILLNISRDLKKMYENGIIMSDMNFGNIRIDNENHHHFLDILSYSIDNIPSNSVSQITLDYLKKNRKKLSTSKNNDKIAFLLLTIQLFMDKYFYDITDYDFDKNKEKLRRLRDLEEIYYGLKKGYVKDAPYLHELIR